MSNLQLVLPPAEWAENGVKGIAIGQCIIDAEEKGLRRSGGISDNHNAHAHNTMFSGGHPQEFFGWICVQPLDAEKYKASTQMLGRIEDGKLVEPNKLAFHEYAHILAPEDVFAKVDGAKWRGHGPSWQKHLVEFGFPEEVVRYQMKFACRKGPAYKAGFRPLCTVRIRQRDQWGQPIYPAYTRNQLAIVRYVGKEKLHLEFLDIKTNVTIWPYEMVEYVEYPVDLPL